MAIVFAAGFLIPQHLAELEYFRGAAEAFPAALFPPVPSMGDIPTRANDLAQRIDVAFPTGPIHIVAHSMAGLDSRFILSQNLCCLATPGRVASLSMIGTPNMGSPVADFLVGCSPSFFDPRRIVYDSLMELAAELGVPIGAVGELTSGYASGFNKENPDVPHINYFSYAGSGMESFLLKLSNYYIAAEGETPDEKNNDGLVSVRSASWRPLSEPAWPADHFGQVGHCLSNASLVSSFDNVTAYKRILARAGALSAQGAGL